jgi:hypothetical protein
MRGTIPKGLNHSARRCPMRRGLRRVSNPITINFQGWPDGLNQHRRCGLFVVPDTQNKSSPSPARSPPNGRERGRGEVGFRFHLCPRCASDHPRASRPPSSPFPPVHAILHHRFSILAGFRLRTPHSPFRVLPSSFPPVHAILHHRFSILAFSIPHSAPPAPPGQSQRD